MKSDIPFGDTTLGAGLGYGFLVLCICLGIGGCEYLSKGPAEVVKIENSFNSTNAVKATK